MVEPITKTWHRRSTETDRSYRAFTLYLNQPPPRTLLFVRNAGYAPASVQKWSKNNEWVKRSIDYDNARTDSIMAIENSTLALYQQKITEYGLEDMQLLRMMWMEAAQKIQAEVDQGKAGGAEHEISASTIIANVNALVKARLDIDKLSRLAARMPDTHKAQVVAEDLDTFPEEVVQLSLTGIVKMELPEPDDEDEEFDEETEVIDFGEGSEETSISD